MPNIERLHPSPGGLKPRILLFLPSNIILQLSSKDKTLSTTQQFIAPTLIASLKRRLLFCTATFVKSTCSMNVSTSTDEGLYKRISLQPEWNLYESSLHTCISQESFIFTNESNIDIEHSYLPSGRPKWICQDLNEFTVFTRQEEYISFDDRNPEKPGFTGAYCWNGLKAGQTVKVSKLKFWFTKDSISGFQASYIVDGAQKVGPRHRCDSEPHVHYPRIFELYEGENVGCVQTFRSSRDPESPIHRLSVVTDRGRCFSVGTECSLSRSAPATLLRHPNAKIVGFRGSIKRGFIAFGFVLEFNKTTATELAGAYRCYVCGVLCSYFTDMKLFQAHVDECVLFLVARQKDLLHANAVD